MYSLYHHPPATAPSKNYNLSTLVHPLLTIFISTELCDYGMPYLPISTELSFDSIKSYMIQQSMLNSSSRSIHPPYQPFHLPILSTTLSYM